MSIASQDHTLADLLARHLVLIEAPIPYNLSNVLAEVNIMNRCASLLVDLLLWREGEESRTHLYNEVHDLHQQRHLTAIELQLRLAALLRTIK